MKNYIPRDAFLVRPGYKMYVQNAANVQMQYQSQRSLVAVHKSAFAKAALAETERTIGGKTVALLTRIAKLRDRKQDTSLPLPRKSDIDVTGGIGKDRKDYIRERKGGTKRVPFTFLSAIGNIVTQRKQSKENFVRVHGKPMEAQSYKVVRDGKRAATR